MNGGINGDILGFPAGHAGEFDLTDHTRQKPRCSNSHATDKLHEPVERAIHAHYEQWRVASG